MNRRRRSPDVILILADDMGFSDLGITGSEIRTPNLDALARGGVVLSAMYNCARCCPTRASLLTGLYPHKAGIGHMGADLGTPAYQGRLRNDAATIAEVLRPAGYRTLMAGKWHVGGDFDARHLDDWRVGDVEHPSPRQRGFDRFYGIVDGATHYFSPHFVMEDDARTEVDPASFYFTDAITDAAVAMVEQAAADDVPYFLYLAHAAPHWPLHAHEEDIARYDGIYQAGWDRLRQDRRERLLAGGLLQHPWELSPRNDGAPPWSDAASRDWEAARMATYAAMVDRMDQAIGRVVDAVRRLGRLDDTLILFLSDNGGCAEFMAEDGWAKYYPRVHLDGRPITMGNRPGLRPGGPLTFMSYDLPWANLSNAPFRLFKHWVHEGGISTPLVAHWPGGVAARGVRHDAAHVIDLLPTILAATGAHYPAEIGGHPIQALDGESLLPLLNDRPWQRERPLFWEHEGNCAIRCCHLKLVRVAGAPWELYDMEADRTELNDLAGRMKPLEVRLEEDFERWAQVCGVEPWDRLWPRLQAAWGLAETHG
jgi:arylsulfatase A-like enzyme